MVGEATQLHGNAFWGHWRRGGQLLDSRTAVVVEGLGLRTQPEWGVGVPRLTRSVSCWRWRSWPGGSERRAKEWEEWARRMNFEVFQSVEEPKCLGGVLPGEDSTSWSWFCPCYGWEEVFISYKEAVAPNRRRYLVRHGDTSFFRRPNCVPVL
jgi:hypothetical protein